MKNNFVNDIVKQVTAIGSSLGKIPWLAICGFVASVIIFVPLLFAPAEESPSDSANGTASAAVSPVNSGSTSISPDQSATPNDSGFVSTPNAPPPEIKMTFGGTTSLIQGTDNPSNNTSGSAYRFWLVVGAIAIATASVFVYREARLEIFKPGPSPSKDPPAFIELIKRNSDAIQLLETPRRIKRFCNRLRLHHNLLHNGLVENPDGKEWFSDQLYFELLLLFEIDRGLDTKSLQKYLKEDEETFIRMMCEPSPERMEVVRTWANTIGPISPLLLNKSDFFAALLAAKSNVLQPTLKLFFTLNRDTVI